MKQTQPVSRSTTKWVPLLARPAAIPGVAGGPRRALTRTWFDVGSEGLTNREVYVLSLPFIGLNLHLSRHFAQPYLTLLFCFWRALVKSDLELIRAWAANRSRHVRRRVLIWLHNRLRRRYLFLTLLLHTLRAFCFCVHMQVWPLYL